MQMCFRVSHFLMLGNCKLTSVIGTKYTGSNDRWKWQNIKFEDRTVYLEHLGKGLKFTLQAIEYSWDSTEFQVGR